MANPKTKKEPQRQALLVLGMHRSGTSAISGTLSLLGAHAPRSLMEPTKDNPRGYWESVEVMKVNERVLSSAGSRWNDWGPFNPAWFDSVIAEQLRGSLVELVGKEFGTAPLLLIKDPRISRFLPLWVDALRECRVAPRIVITVRHPLGVARSLEVRDHFGRNRSLLLWLRHVLDAEASSRQLPRTFVRYEDMLADWQSEASRIATELDIVWPKWSGDTEVKVGDFLTSELRHHQETEEPIAGDSELGEWVRQTYQTLLQAAAGSLDRAALDNLDRIRGEFNRSSAVYAAVVREHELRVEALYADMKAKLARSVEELQAQNGLLAEAEGKLSETRTALAEQRQQAETLKARVDAEEQLKVQQKSIEEQLALGAAACKQAVELAAAEHAARLAEQEERHERAAREHHEAVERLLAREAEASGLRDEAERQRREAEERSATAAAEYASLLAEKDQAIARITESASAAAAEKDQAIAQLAESASAAAAEKDRAIAQLAESASAAAAEKDRAIAQLAESASAAAAEKDQTIAQLAAEKDQTIARLAAEKDQAIARLAAEKDQAIAQLAERANAAAAEKDQTIAQLAERARAAKAAKAQEIAELTGRIRTMAGEMVAATSEHRSQLEKVQKHLLSREETMAKLARQLSQLKASLAEQSEELSKARNAAETSATVRFRETAKLTEMLFDKDKAALEQAERHTRHATTLEYHNAFTRMMLSRNSDAWQHKASAYAQVLAQIGSSRAWKVLARVHKIRMPELGEPDLEAHIDAQVEALRASEWFDARWYLENYSDAAHSGMEPERHYLLVGAPAGHHPGPRFDTVAYLMEYPDVRETGMNPLVHYIEHGRTESRTTVAPAEAHG
ncbi:MAG: sulfotransferase [Lysobacter sp.]|nr:sulfotransferase [Lysobacter sp.]